MLRGATSLFCLGAVAIAFAQSLHWKPAKGHVSYTALYGEVTVLADDPGTYFCGVDWWASHPAAGATGIEAESTEQKRVLFSVWPTDKGDNAFPRVGQTNPHLKTLLAKNDVHGSHCDVAYKWEPGHTYQFYLTKGLDPNNGSIIVSLFFYDEHTRQWVGEGRIISPIDGKPSVDSFNGALTSSIANLRKKDDLQEDKPRLALFRLWAGTGPDNLEMITTAGGAGEWGTMNGAFFLAYGYKNPVAQAMRENLAADGKAEFGNKKEKLEIPAVRVPAEVVRALEGLR